MGCDYYVYTALKMIHKNGISFLNLREQPFYASYFNDDEDFLKHPSLRRPKIDHMKIDLPDELIYTKGKPLYDDPNMPKYRELIEEYIKDFSIEDYKTKNKIIQNLGMFDNPLNGECLKSFDDIDEIYIVELRGWRN
jgi:hypothetical protein